ncbi:MAG: Rrf2 family transcriptional regulator [Bacillota bacterium]
MKISTKSRYGLKAVHYLAKNSDEILPITRISADLGISQDYLEQLMRLLKKADIIQTTRGVQGGYQLARKPKEITVGEVLRVLEDNLQIVECVGEAPCQKNCPTKDVWEKVYIAINETLDQITLDQMV